jgi:hypothetical protein
MNRLTFKQRGSISAIAASAPQTTANRYGRPAADAAAMLNSRKAFTSERTSNVAHKVDQSHETKRTDRRPRMLLGEHGMLMHLTVDSCDVTDLRLRVAAACGDCMLFMRIQPLHHASKMRVWILLQRRDFDFVTRAIKAGLPEAEQAIAALGGH